MNAGLFDTLKYARRLQQAGFSPEQADGATEALASALWDEIATKSDLRDQSTDLKNDIRALRAELKDDIGDLRAEVLDLKTDLKGDISKLTGEIAKLGGEIAKLGGDMRAEISILRADTAKWIIGAVFVNFAGILGAVALIWQLARR